MLSSQKIPCSPTGAKQDTVSIVPPSFGCQTTVVPKKLQFPRDLILGEERAETRCSQRTLSPRKRFYIVLNSVGHLQEGLRPDNENGWNDTLIRATQLCGPLALCLNLDLMSGS